MQYMGYPEDQLQIMIKFWEDNKQMTDRPKHIMTRAEAIALFKEYMPDVSKADKTVDFYVAAGMLEIKEEIPKKVVVLFEERASDGGVIRLETWPEGLVLWVNGKIKYKYWEDTNK